MGKMSKVVQVIIVGVAFVIGISILSMVISIITNNSSVYSNNIIEDIHPMSLETPDLTIYNSIGGYDCIRRQYFHYIVDNKTGVVYLLYESSVGATMTPMYNESGELITKNQLELK